MKKIIFFCMSVLSFATTQSEAMFQTQVLEKISYVELKNKYNDLIQNYNLSCNDIETDEDKAQFDIYVAKEFIYYINSLCPFRQDLTADDLDKGRNALAHFFPDQYIHDENKLVQMILDFLKEMKALNIQSTNLHLAMIAENYSNSVIAKYENKWLCLVL